MFNFSNDDGIPYCRKCVPRTLVNPSQDVIEFFKVYCGYGGNYTDNGHKVFVFNCNCQVCPDYNEKDNDQRRN